MQTITPELTAILKDKFQAGAQGFRGRIEVGSLGDNILDNFNRTEGSDLGDASSGGTWDPAGTGGSASVDGAKAVFSATGLLTYDLDYAGDGTVTMRAIFHPNSVPGSGANNWGGFIFQLQDFDGTYHSAAQLLISVSTGVDGKILLSSVYGSPAETAKTDWATVDYYAKLQYSPGVQARGKVWKTTDPEPAAWQVSLALSGGDDVAKIRIGVQRGSAASSPFVGSIDDLRFQGVLGFSEVGRLIRLSIDKSLASDADAFEAELNNSDGVLDLSAEAVQPDMPVRVFQWYGDQANEVQTFYGLVDKVHQHRQPRTVTITGRDWMKKLLVQNCDFPYPQGADDTTGTGVRDETNGVFLGWEIGAIVTYLMDLAGLPGGQQDVTSTGITLDEFIAADGSSFANEISKLADIAGDNVTGYLFYADEFGVIHFTPDDKTTGDPVYTFDATEDVYVIDPEVDDLGSYTRVRAVGPMTTTASAEAWDLVWQTGVVTKPVGAWYIASDSGNIRVLDRGTKRIYVIQQSDQTIVSSWYIGDTVPYPLGLSGDPADSSIYWVLSAPWRATGGSTYGSRTGNRVHKFAVADNSHLASYALPDGRWSDLKVSSANGWATDLDTDQLWNFDKTTWVPASGYSVAANPTGIGVDGTDLYTFSLDGHAYVSSEGSPLTITRTIVSSPGMYGGEIDTSTSADVYVTSDDLGQVWKYTLSTTTETTYDVFATAVDSAFESELETLSGTPEQRLLIVRMDAVLSLADAQNTADRWLAKVAHFREQFDFGIVGNPAIQKTDQVTIIDAVSGVSRDIQAGTIRSEMTGGGTYLAVISGTPWDGTY